MQTTLGVHRHRAMLMAFSGQVRARIASPETILSEIDGIDCDDLLGTVKVGRICTEWTSWLSHNALDPVDDSLSFSAVRYRRGSGAYPW
ncbi:MAG: hypothetical protein EOO82_03775 [Oxalobacteraceae bacterium]|nr:MAG: hypothetical protein EOO82_03775 [Oxalobacteraceae bacterium]